MFSYALLGVDWRQQFARESADVYTRSLFDVLSLHHCWWWLSLIRTAEKMEQNVCDRIRELIQQSYVNTSLDISVGYICCCFEQTLNNIRALDIASIISGPLSNRAPAMTSLCHDANAQHAWVMCHFDTPLLVKILTSPVVVLTVGRRLDHCWLAVDHVSSGHMIRPSILSFPHMTTHYLAQLLITQM